ncbi:hypothetical protein [Chryseobacterium sp. SC28]|uniref:hypothetical protein n=1 Tax=Chryseobacterium sp. SC28 TaxID=2268028 RepID=UPI0016277B05|nr:hypothetical protein [Chryseobacterium sp. SC28]
MADKNFKISGAGNLLSAAIPRALLSHRLLRDFRYHQAMGFYIKSRFANKNVICHSAGI